MRTVALGILLWCCAVNAADDSGDLAGGRPSYRLFFPPFKRVETGDGSGRVTAIRVVTRCAYITRILRIPGDWWIEMQGPISGETTFAASAGHGASYLWNLEPWNGSIAVTPYIPSCFDIEAEIVTDGSNDEAVVIRYKRSQLKLKP